MDDWVGEAFLYLANVQRYSHLLYLSASLALDKLPQALDRLEEIWLGRP